jgi:hypothetical protein
MAQFEVEHKVKLSARRRDGQQNVSIDVEFE